MKDGQILQRYGNSATKAEKNLANKKAKTDFSTPAATKIPKTLAATVSPATKNIHQGKRIYLG